MSSSEQCTFQGCQCHTDSHKKPNQFNDKRPSHNVLIFQRNQYRHHHAKRRFPPNKKQFFNKDITQTPKNAPKVQNVNIFHPNKYNLNPRFNQNYLINKASCDKTYGIDVPYHAVGQSQREKLNSPSPQMSQNIIQSEMKKAPLTDRDRRVYSNNLIGQNLLTQTNKNRLPQNFITNLSNPELFPQVLTSSQGNGQKNEK